MWQTCSLPPVWDSFSVAVENVNLCASGFGGRSYVLLSASIMRFHGGRLAFGTEYSHPSASKFRPLGPRNKNHSLGGFGIGFNIFSVVQEPKIHLRRSTAYSSPDSPQGHKYIGSKIEALLVLAWTSKKSQNNGPYTTYTLCFEIVGHYFGLFWRSRWKVVRPQGGTLCSMPRTSIGLHCSWVLHPSASAFCPARNSEGFNWNGLHMPTPHLP